MREVSQKWIENQNKTLRDQGLLRLDFLSTHNNNAKAHIIPMGSDATKSNINEIKDILPYGAPNKNLAMPDLTGKEYLGGGEYLLVRYNTANPFTLTYNIYDGVYTFNGLPSNVGAFKLNDLSVPVGNYVTMSFIYVSGTSSDNARPFFRLGSNAKDVRYIRPNKTYEIESNDNLFATYFGDNISYNNYKVKLQIENGSQATDYVVPQPNTGYVSANPSGLNGEVATNLAMPNLSTATDLGGGNYRLYSANGVTLDYNVNTGIYTLNGTNTNTSEAEIRFMDFNYSGTYTMSYEYISGTYTGNALSINTAPYSGERLSKAINGVSGTVTGTNDFIRVFIYLGTAQRTYNNYKFKLQLEKGDTASAYQLPNFTPIEVHIENYRSPLNGLTITWSENFGYAVDYSIEYNGEVYNYLNNTKKTVFVPIIVENSPDANFKIRVNKWSQGGVPIRIERIFVGLHIINYQDRIFSFSKKRVNDVLSLELPQDEIHFELNNVDRMFDPLWYNSYFKYLNEKTEIRVYSGFKIDGKNDEWIKNGTFYLTDWKAPNNSITATFTARDILNLLDADEMYSKAGPLTLDEYCDIILSRDYKGVDNFEDYNLPVNPDGSKKWNIRKNLATPDLTGKPEISAGVYRLYDANGITIDYDYWTGEFTINGTYGTNLANFIPLGVPTYVNSPLIFSCVDVSGTVSHNERPLFSYSLNGSVNDTFFFYPNRSPQITDTLNGNFVFGIRRISTQNGITYDNFKFKLQIEKGSTATEYRLPIENVSVPVSMETRTKREVLQLLAHSVGAHIHIDDDANISFIRDETGRQLIANKKIMLSKPEFNIASPIKKIIVPITTYASDPNELELARIQVTAGELIEINHDLPYSGGRVELSGSLTVASQDNSWYRSYKILVGGSGSGELVLYRHQMTKTTINLVQDIGSSGTTMTYENPMIDTNLKASRALNRIWTEISNSREVEFNLRIDPLFNTLDVVSFPFKVLDLEQTEFMRIDELEIDYNGAYKGKIKGVILSNYGGDLAPKTYIKHSKEFNSGEENLKWHLSNKQ